MNFKIFILTVFLLSGMSLRAQNNMELTIDPRNTAGTIPGDYIGLSYETRELLPDEQGRYYFDADNKALVSVFKSLNIKSLRIGGNSTDVANIPIPSEKDIDYLFRFARAAGVKVIYSVRLKDGDPVSAARIARHIHDHYAEWLDYFAIGNESSYYKDFKNELRPRWEAIHRAMREAAPTARFCAIDDNVSTPLYKNVADTWGAPGGPVELITFHNYPGDCAYTNPFKINNVSELIPFDAAEKRDFILSPAMKETYNKVYNTVVPHIGGRPFRLSETNSVWYGGLEGASDSYASALWGIDYMHWWAMHGAVGMNLHTGDRVGGGDRSVPCRYATFVTGDDGFDIRPLSYAVKLFSLGAQGKMIPLAVPNGHDHFSAYATFDDDRMLSVTLINKSHGGTAENERVTLSLPSSFEITGKPRRIALEAPGGDVALKQGVTVGASSIAPDGKWRGKWTALEPTDNQTITIEVPAASALLIRIKVKQNN